MYEIDCICGWVKDCSISSALEILLSWTKPLIFDGSNLILLYISSLMFWTDWGSEPKIERAIMDGTERKVIVSDNLGWPNGITIDRPTSRIIWADARTEASVNSLRAKFFRVNINIYLHFMSFLHTYKTRVFEIPPRVRQGPAHFT